MQSGDMVRNLVVSLALTAGLAVQGAQAQDTSLFVAPNGNDAWSGKLAEPNAEKTDGPFGTLERALDAVHFGIGMRSMIGPMVQGGGESYIAFFTPGIVALSALGGAVGGGMVWLDERTRGVVKEYLAAPIPRLTILLGNALSTVTRSLLQAIVIFVVGVLMGAQMALDPLGWAGGLALVGGYGVGFAGIALAVERRVGLVEQDDARRAGQGAGHGDGLLGTGR